MKSFWLTGFILSLKYRMIRIGMSSAARAKRWCHPETVKLLELILENLTSFGSAKGRTNTRLEFFNKDIFKEIQTSGRTAEQMNTRLENLLKEYRKVRIFIPVSSILPPSQNFRICFVHIHIIRA